MKNILLSISMAISLPIFSSQSEVRSESKPVVVLSDVARIIQEIEHNARENIIDDQIQDIIDLFSKSHAHMALISSISASKDRTEQPTQNDKSDEGVDLSKACKAVGQDIAVNFLRSVAGQIMPVVAAYIGFKILNKCGLASPQQVS